MSQFGKLYSQYYDLLYKDKDYISEVKYVDALIKQYSGSNETLLDLGCGTGKHAALFCDKGYKVLGVDLSNDMLKLAEDRLIGREDRLRFNLSNITDLELNEEFDVVVSLFHVMSYQASSEALIKTFEVVKEHLKKGGVFVFDFWYGPAVLTDLPVIKTTRLEDKSIKVLRVAEPEIYAQENIVDVNFNVFIEDKKTNEIIAKKELHKMRYFFDTELEMMCDRLGFIIETKLRWMSNDDPDFDSWNVVWVLKK